MILELPWCALQWEKFVKQKQLFTDPSFKAWKELTWEWLLRPKLTQIIAWITNINGMDLAQAMLLSYNVGNHMLFLIPYVGNHISHLFPGWVDIY